mmetsp:Transcript_10745/g.21576  ORF Transcript_10745/g.21576 Transcript_10745/m.21576 type:complete len:230 (-) Transcript_10745:622-1311(-)|eukprot:CAMPEP_0184684624 /NCGR_PEP_ID=MMETSP0312-20130426/16020_1 /TAXON_ID=31354 /ORGANISM="Compsopogon coeruleus, Strain SAG 36.94" /LENGTH=229 /DNA_ID=CAMNT_0027137979 /DNA_START=68 /DNA_END=757 /DNA_ORIENTATION=-
MNRRGRGGRTLPALDNGDGGGDNAGGEHRTGRRVSKRSTRATEIYDYGDDEDDELDDDPEVFSDGAGGVSVASTRTHESVLSLSDAPPDPPSVDLETALKQYHGDVPSFLAWQSRKVSEQTASLKANHGYVRRLLRKRNQRQSIVDKVMAEVSRASRIKLVSLSSKRERRCSILEQAAIQIPLEAYIPSRPVGIAHQPDLETLQKRGPRRSPAKGDWKSPRSQREAEIK